jgi:hypothetical protein
MEEYRIVKGERLVEDWERDQNEDGWAMEIQVFRRSCRIFLSLLLEESVRFLITG